MKEWRPWFNSYISKVGRIGMRASKNSFAARLREEGGIPFLRQCLRDWRNNFEEDSWWDKRLLTFPCSVKLCRHHSKWYRCAHLRISQLWLESEDGECRKEQKKKLMLVATATLVPLKKSRRGLEEETWYSNY